MKKSSVTKSYIFEWTPARLKAVKLAASTDMTQEQIAQECNVTRKTVNVWFQAPEFNEKISEYVLSDERATKAGLVKRALNTLDGKSEQALKDKSTELDYMKFIADIMGINKQGNEVNIFNAVGVVNTQEVKDAAAKLCEKLREADDSTE